jgi:hypothetical protein
MLEKGLPGIWNQNQAVVAILISEKVDFTPKSEEMKVTIYQ